MSRSPFIVSLPYTPSSAWAARPLASGARSRLIERRSVRFLGVGCPSFGGQRSVGDSSRRLLAGLVADSMPRCWVTGMGAFFVGFNSQTVRSAASWVLSGSGTASGVVAHLCTAEFFAFGSRSKGRSYSGWSVETAAIAKVVALGKVHTARSCWVGLTETAKILAPVRQSRAPSSRRVRSAPARPSRWGWRASVGVSSAPNPSVKGTSCAYAQAAPYLER